MKLGYFAGVAVALALGCQREPDISVAVTRLEVSFDQQGPSAVRIRAWGAWRAESSERWCRVEPHNDTTLYIWVEPNMGLSARQTVIRVMDRSSSTALLLNQKILAGLDFNRYGDSLALMSIFRQGGGKEWTWSVGFERNLKDCWSPDQTISNWQGVGTEQIDGSLRVRSLDLRSINNFSGALPDSLALMNKLSALYLSSLPLTASPLETLSKLDAVEALDLSFAPYPLVWPAQMGGLRSLVLLYASGIKHPSNRLDPKWSELEQLHLVELAGGGLEGGFPQVLLDKSGIESLDVSNNPKMGGVLPTQIAQMAALEHLDVSLCGLTGSLPAELGQLAHLMTLKAAGNRLLGGAIPATLGQIRNLQVLNLSECALTSLPLEIWNCANLRYLDVSSNRLTGPIPVAVASMQHLDFLGLRGNRLSGAIPTEVLGCAHWAGWYPQSWICRQQTGYKFSNYQCNENSSRSFGRGR